MSKESKRVSDAIKPALSGALSAQFYASLVALPGIGWFFALPVVSYFTKTVLNKITDWMVSETAVGLSVLWIMLDMQYEVSTAEKGAARLKDMLENPAKYTKEEADGIERDFDDQTVDLIQLSIARL